MDFQVILADLNTKLPCLQHILRPEYAPYLNTAGTVLLGWLIISWISYLVWMLFAPLTVTVIAIILISPMTAKWCLKQTVPGLETIFNEFAEKFQTVLSRVRG
ncbi:uncharacterized protein LOC117606537 [Osmia lignaria lignaria]|uniref:uncharacterized protein LOC117606537 n=1 Tax=Osmia lignaria lignaria TaxID=1437193 RepID=UPI00147902E4|nr:uncharacterized protein LOC117606537 [Osmia lignaria]